MQRHQALAELILPTICTNISQSLRQGLPAAVATTRQYHRFLIAPLVMLVVQAQFVEMIPQALILPAMVGQAAGFAVHDRLDQARFRRWTQGLLVLTELNLVRQALM